MKGIMGLLNGAPIPNWMKLLILGAVIGIAIGVNQSAVSTLSKGQDELKAEVRGLRADLKTAIGVVADVRVLDEKVSNMEDRLRRIDGPR